MKIIAAAIAIVAAVVAAPRAEAKQDYLRRESLAKGVERGLTNDKPKNPNYKKYQKKRGEGMKAATTTTTTAAPISVRYSSSK